MTQHDDETGKGRKRLSQGWLLAGVLVLTAGVAGAAGAGVASVHGLHGMHAMIHGGQSHMDPAAMDAHFDEMIGQVLPDATPQQKVKLKAIVGSFHADMHALHASFGQAHERLLALFQQPTVDRAAMEALRVQQLQQVDATSARMVKALADAAEVLTPAQRVQFANHIKMQMH